MLNNFDNIYTTTLSYIYNSLENLNVRPYEHPSFTFTLSAVFFLVFAKLLDVNNNESIKTLT